MLDLKIINGTIVDGTGTPGRPGSIGVRDGRIVAVGEVTEEAAETLDIAGHIVAPGFIDPHTHYDAQLFWDPTASPSNLHGITTIMAGNCGFTLAPLAPGDADWLRAMMAKVEGMDIKALEQGLEWDWESFGDYLDRLRGNIAVNAGFLVGHSAIRRVVMGEAATGNEATPEQIESMKALLRASIEAGGMGFSTSLSFTHNDGSGQPIPSRWASREEVLELCRVAGEYPGTTLEYVGDGCLNGFEAEEIDLMTEMSLAAQRPVNWNVLTVDSHDPARYANQLGLGVKARARGGRVVSLTMPILVGMNMSFNTYCALNMLPDWSETLGLPVPERIEKLRDPEVRAFLDARAQSPEAGSFMRLVGWGLYRIGTTFSAENEGLSGRLVSDIAAERGVSNFDALLDVVIADDLRTVLWPGPTDDDEESWRMRAEAWTWPDVLIGGSDAGAHLDRMCGAPYTSMFLADAIRGQQLISMEEAVRLITDVPARLFGFTDRGVLAEGKLADIVVFDPKTVDAGEIELREDLPGNSKRLFSGAVGVPHVLVNGVFTVRDGAATDALPGLLFTPGVDTETVTP